MPPTRNPLRPLVLRAVRPLAAALPASGWLFLFVLYVIAAWIGIAYRVQWGPDTPFYLAWTYRLLGYPDAEAVARTVGFLAHMDGVNCAVSPLPWCHAENYQMYFSGDFAATVGPRLVVPLVAAPFVGLFGPPAMVGVSLLAYAVAVVCVVVLAARMFGPGFALPAGVLMIVPWLVSNWGVHANTEALALALGTAALLSLPLRRRARRRDVIWFLVLLEFGLFTRQFAVVLIAGTVLAWALSAVRERRARTAWAPFAAVAVLGGALSVWIQGRITASYAPGFSVLRTYESNTGTSDLRGALAAVPGTAARILWGDLRHVRTDVVLAAVLGLALVSVLWRWRDELSALTVGAFGATLALNLITNSDSIFRYHVPIYPLYLLSALALVADLTVGRQPAHRVDVAGAETTGPRWAGVPRAGWFALAAAYLVAIVLTRPAALARAEAGIGPGIGAPPGPDLPGALVPIVGYAVAVVAVVVLAGRRWGGWGLLAGVFMLVPTAVVQLGRPAFAGAVAAAAVALGAHTLPTAGSAVRGARWWFAAAMLAATVVEPYAAVVLGGVALVWLADRSGHRREWGRALAAGSAAAVPGVAIGILLHLPARDALTGGVLSLDLMLVTLALLVGAGLLLGVWRGEPAVLLGAGSLAAVLAVVLVSALVAAPASVPVTAFIPFVALGAGAVVVRTRALSVAAHRLRAPDGGAAAPVGSPIVDGAGV